MMGEEENNNLSYKLIHYIIYHIPLYYGHQNNSLIYPNIMECMKHLFDIQ